MILWAEIPRGNFCSFRTKANASFEVAGLTGPRRRGRFRFATGSGGKPSIFAKAFWVFGLSIMQI
jgi:hypothetical protein